ncbi:transcription initiation factor TFIID subunit 11-like protein [Tanacetum coccineum]
MCFLSRLDVKQLNHLFTPVAFCVHNDRQHHWKQQNLNAHDHCGIAKIFVGELVETAKVVMRERSETGPIRPCHIREAYRRLKPEGKMPKISVQRLFR